MQEFHTHFIGQSAPSTQAIHTPNRTDPVNNDIARNLPRTKGNEDEKRKTTEAQKSEEGKWVGYLGGRPGGTEAVAYTLMSSNSCLILISMCVGERGQMEMSKERSEDTPEWYVARDYGMVMNDLDEDGRFDSFSLRALESPLDARGKEKKGLSPEKEVAVRPSAENRNPRIVAPYNVRDIAFLASSSLTGWLWEPPYLPTRSADRGRAYTLQLPRNNGILIVR